MRIKGDTLADPWLAAKVWIIAALVFGVPLHASEPAWWRATSTAIIEVGAPEDNYAPANLGQLKHTAQQAKQHLDEFLPGGSGAALAALVADFATSPTAENFAPVNIGQLKAIAKPFYNRLISEHYPLRLSFNQHGVAVGVVPYPWNPATPVADNYGPANLGQLKLTFSFDVTDGDGDTMPDWWETLHGLDPTTDDSTGNLDGDANNNLTEYRTGGNPSTGLVANGTGLVVWTPLQ
ncbi:MAG: hypothetical protein WA771_07330 [Chthoniobacterales bacterium]